MSLANPELELATAFVEHTNCALFLTGKAGTGKTTFLHRIKEQTHKRMVVTAPTGVAAINAGGVTLHSFFQLPFRPLHPRLRTAGRPASGQPGKTQHHQSLDLLVIDEISMVRADLLDGVDAVLRRYRRSELPFGGVQVLMIGDLHQLAPVAKEAEWQMLRPYYSSPYFFSSAALQRMELIPIELKHIYRQSDQTLHRPAEPGARQPARPGQPGAAQLPLPARFLAGENDGAITLCTHNSSADAINRTRLAALPGPAAGLRPESRAPFPNTPIPPPPAWN
jgi:hypothetical protein